MRIEQYLTHTDYALWEVIVNGDAPAVASASAEGPFPPKTAEQKLARKNELKAKSTLLLAIPDEHILKFHGIKDAKPPSLEAIKAMFGGNKESKNTWNNIALIMRNKSDLDTLSRDDLYNNLKVSESEIKGQSSLSSSSNSQNVDFVSLENTSIILDNEDLEQIVPDDLEEDGSNAGGRMAPRNQRNRNGDVSRRIIPVETPANALVVQDGIGGYGWSFQAEEGPTNFSLMAHLSLGSSSSSCSDSEVRDNSITKLKNQLAEALREKDNMKLKLEKFETSSKKLTDLLNSQISVNNKTGIGIDSQMTKNELHDIHKNNSEMFVSASDSSVNEIKEENNHVNDSVPRNESTESKSSKDNLEPPKDVRPSAPIVEEWESDSDDDCVTRPSIEQNKPSYAKINFFKSNENTRKSVIEQNTYRQAENLRKSQSPRADKRNWNGRMTQKLGDGFEFNKKACFVFLTKSGNVLVNTAKQSSSRAAVSNSTARYVNTAASRPTMNGAKPCSNVFHKSHSSVKRTIYQRTTPKNSDFKEKVNTAKVNNVTTAGTKAVVSVVQGHEENAVKSSACWIWRPTGKVIDHISKDSGSYMPKRFDYGNPQYALQDQGIFDSGCSRHMTGNKSYLTDYQDIDGGFVAFAGSPKGGKITGKGKIRTGKLDFEDVYFVKELKFNLFSVSQMCDKKNSVLFTETECLVLSLDFKLLDESQVKSIRCDNGTEFKNNDMNQFCRMKGIKRKFSVARTPQQNEVAKRKNRTLIEAARTMLVDSLLPTTFWDEAVSTAYYVQNRDAVVDDAGQKANEEPSNEGETNGQEKDRGALNKENDQNVQDFRAELDNLLVQQKEDVGAEADLNNLETTTNKQERLKREWKLEIEAKTVAQGYTQEEGIDYDEVFAPIVRIEAIRSMIGSLMYLTASRPDIMFTVCACASDYAGASLDRKSTTEDETIYKEWEDRIKRVATTASSLEADRSNDKHKGVYVTPSHTKKVFANMKRPCKGFSGRVTPLFSMMVQATEDMGTDSATPTDSHSTPIITQPSSSNPQKKKSSRKQRKDSAPTKPTTEETIPEEHVATPSCDPPQRTTKSNQALEIESLKRRVKQLEKRRKSRTLGLRRLRKVSSSSRVESFNDASLDAQEDASKQGRKITDLDADAEVTLVDKTQEINDDNLRFDTSVLEEQEIEFENVVEEPVVSVATTTKSIPVRAAKVVTTTSANVEIPDELTLA
ncbi:ribonuclease H-like domain-containing protein [Tanacetum coccineum]